jgi:uncharacterized protein (DUF2147 family)
MRRKSVFGLGAAAVLAALSFSAVSATQPGTANLPSLGYWLAWEDKILVELYPCGDEVCGKIAWMLRPRFKRSGELRRDTENPDPALRDRLWCGIEAIEGLKPAPDGSLHDGSFYYPKDGLTYSLELTPNRDGTLTAHGYMGIKLVGKSETWTRPGPEIEPHCETED